ncbi:MAG: hypothetical protein Q8Q14_03070 [Gemmatimonadales bacterium]|nr:hypothetical protein [Gemmatimonadales bacterium]
MKTATTDKLIEIIKTAQADWTGGDWTHKRRVGGEIQLDADGEPVYCDGSKAGCSYCAEAKGDAARAAFRGDAAISAIRRGDMDTALALMEAAREIEDTWGDSPAYAPAVKAVEAAVVDDDEDEDEDDEGATAVEADDIVAIDALRTEAGAAGDAAMVAICDRAILGDEDAMRDVRDALESARAMIDDDED